MIIQLDDSDIKALEVLKHQLQNKKQEYISFEERQQDPQLDILADALSILDIFLSSIKSRNTESEGKQTHHLKIIREGFYESENSVDGQVYLTLEEALNPWLKDGWKVLNTFQEKGSDVDFFYIAHIIKEVEQGGISP